MMNTPIFNSETDVVSYYEQRYAGGYLRSWRPEKTQKLFELLSELGLPRHGKALDFGCGNGVLTNIIKTALPEWDIYGCDISQVAIANARQAYRECSFFLHTHDISQEYRNQFDLLFTHHVLEHVPDCEQTFLEMNAYLKTDSRMFHILPCGNPGSFEYQICALVKNGIDPQMGNRFFFEDEAHLRRLTTTDVSGHAERFGFRLQKQWYANQHYGGMLWIAEAGENFILKLTNPSSAINANTLGTFRRQLFRLSRYHELSRLSGHDCREQIISSLKKSYRIVSHPTEWKQTYQKLWRQIKKIGRALYWLCMIPLAKIIWAYYEKQAAKEWRFHNGHPNGSEMYLLYVR